MPPVMLADIAERISVPVAKVSGYLLNVNHPKGGPKARFFMLFGFHPDDPVALIDALLEHGATHPSTQTTQGLGATVYTLEGEIDSPDGRNPRIRSVWQVDSGTVVARFITAVPLSERRSSRDP